MVSSTTKNLLNRTKTTSATNKQTKQTKQTNKQASKQATIFAKTGWHIFTFLYYMSILVYRNAKKSSPLPPPPVSKLL